MAVKRSPRQGAGGTLPLMHMPSSPSPSISRGGNGMTNKRFGGKEQVLHEGTC